jgi:chromosome partitioning protein
VLDLRIEIGVTAVKRSTALETIALVTTKGGAGKSTTAIHLAVAACEAGYRVLLVDLDPQQTAKQWADRRNKPAPEVTATSVAGLHNLLQRAANAGYQMAIIDTPGNDIGALAASVVAADLSLLVARPTQPDIEVAAQVRDAIEAAGRSFAILVVQAPPVLSRRLQAWLQTCCALGLVATVSMGARFDFQDALAYGAGVTEWNPRGAAAHEVWGVLGWIQRKLNGGDHDATQAA